jgi:hypothetical protein
MGRRRCPGQDLKDLHDKPLPVDAGQGHLLDAATHAMRRAEQVAELKLDGRSEPTRCWQLRAQWQRKDCPIDKKKLGEANGTKWLQALKAWASDAAAEVPSWAWAPSGSRVRAC